MSTPQEAVTAAGRVLAVILHEQAQWYEQGGAEAVVREGRLNGTPQQKAEAAALYESLRKRGASAA